MILNEIDRALADQYGSYASYDDTDVAPVVVDYHGELPPHLETERLLDVYGRPESCVLDLGCGAGFTLCRVAAAVREAWGFDQDARLLDAARQRVAAMELTNATLIEGNVAVERDVAQLPVGRFDLVLSQRGPNLNAGVMRALVPAATVVQEVASNGDAYPLKEIFGRRTYAPYHEPGYDGLYHYYADLGLLPVSTKEYYYDEYYRDSDHLEAMLARGMVLAEWRVPTPGGYRSDRDRAALDLYVRYNRTAKGIRVMRRRAVFVFRRADIAYYPADGVPAGAAD